MGVFLRWGVFGILAVAAMVYAYNASRRLTERRPAPAQVASASQADPDEVEEPPPETALQEEQEPDMPGACEEELMVAERALKMRRDGEPLDRLLRIDRIAFQADAERRQRLEAVARRWFEREGRDPDAARLRVEVRRDCGRAFPATPAP
ncbi:MAG TPA: hypothetical protein VF033_09365 [Steroidobacteraceae bacterium]|jgi:hypothetical protein